MDTLMCVLKTERRATSVTMPDERQALNSRHNLRFGISPNLAISFRLRLPQQRGEVLSWRQNSASEGFVRLGCTASGVASNRGTAETAGFCQSVRNRVHLSDPSEAQSSDSSAHGPENIQEVLSWRQEFASEGFVRWACTASGEGFARTLD